MIPTGEGVNEDYRLLGLQGGDEWTIRDAFEGTQIFGATGSGKSSGSGRTLAIHCLKAGMGGLVLTAKADECDQWRKYLAAAGRSQDDLIEFSPQEDLTFPFFEYERSVAEAENMPVIEPVVNLFSVLLEVTQRKSGGGQEAYWVLAVRQLVRNAAELLVLSSLPLTFENLYLLITSAPVTQDESDNISVSLDDTNDASSFFQQCLHAAVPKLEDESESSLNLTVSYWLKEYVNLAPETRSGIVSYFTSIADVFARGVLKKLFSPSILTSAGNQSGFAPELSRQGKILIFNLPVKKYFETGQLAQVLYKYIWQRAAERQATLSGDVRPMFLWADEAQFFVNSYDMMFQTTARSAKVATFYLTQNISNYYAVMPGDRAKPETDSLLGNFNTKILHANTDSVTNTWASDLIGKNWQFRKSFASSVSSSLSDPGGKNLFSLKNLLLTTGRSNSTNINSSKNEILDYQVIPLEFTKLRKGGKAADFKVDGIFTQGGRVLKNGRIYDKLEFDQGVKP